MPLDFNEDQPTDDRRGSNISKAIIEVVTFAIWFLLFIGLFPWIKVPERKRKERKRYFKRRL